MLGGEKRKKKMEKKKEKEKKEAFKFSLAGLCINTTKFSYQYFLPSWYADLTNSVCRNMSVLLVGLTETRLVSNWNLFVFTPACFLTSPGSRSEQLPPKRYFPACLGMNRAFPFKIGSRVFCLSHSSLGWMDISSHFLDKFFRIVKYSLSFKAISLLNVGRNLRSWYELGQPKLTEDTSLGHKPKVLDVLPF